MMRPSFRTLLGSALCLLTLAWLYGGELLDASRARSAEVSAFLAPPPMVWPAGVLAAAVGALGVVLWGLMRGKGEDFKGYRLPSILLLCALAFDLVRAESQGPLLPEDVAVLVLRQLEDGAEALSDGRTVPSDPARLQPLLAGLEPPPYLVRGQRVAAWSLQVRQECQGPVLEASGLAVGTLLYCVAPGRQRAWISLVALPAGERFGIPSILSVEGAPYVAVVQPPLPEEESPLAGSPGPSVEAPAPTP